jgi:thioredoxin-related protein
MRFSTFLFLLVSFQVIGCLKTSLIAQSKNSIWLTWEEAVFKIQDDRQKKTSPKKILIKVYAHHCGWCERMQQETLDKPVILNYIKKHFYLVELNASDKKAITFAGKTFNFVPTGRSGYHELAAALLDGKMLYPTTVFLDNNFQLIQRIPGFHKAATFEPIVHYLAEEHYLKTPWANYQKNYLSK